MADKFEDAMMHNNLDEIRACYEELQEKIKELRFEVMVSNDNTGQVMESNRELYEENVQIKENFEALNEIHRKELSASNERFRKLEAIRELLRKVDEINSSMPDDLKKRSYQVNAYEFFNKIKEVLKETSIESDIKWKEDEP